MAENISIDQMYNIPPTLPHTMGRLRRTVASGLLIGMGLTGCGAAASQPSGETRTITLEGNQPDGGGGSGAGNSEASDEQQAAQTGTEDATDAVLGDEGTAVFADELADMNEYAISSKGKMITKKTRRAAGFKRSEGVVVHVGDPNSEDVSEIMRELKILGIRQIRTSTKDMTMLKVLARNGITFDYMLRPPVASAEAMSRLTPAEITASVQAGLQPLIDNGLQKEVIKIENWNEIDDKNGPKNYYDLLRVSQAAISATAKKPFPNAVILGPSLVGYKLDKDAAMVGDLSATLDNGAIHSYSSLSPAMEPVKPDPKGCESLDDASTTWQRLVIVSTCISGGKPVVITETGYTDNKEDAVTSRFITSRRAAAVLTQQTMFENFKAGIRQTFVYDLVDDVRTTGPAYENHFGFFDREHKVKQSAVDQHQVTLLLKDNGANRTTFRRHELAYKVGASADKNSNIREVVLEKSDGSKWLAVYDAGAVVDPKTGQDTARLNRRQTIRIQLGDKAVATAHYIGTAGFKEGVNACVGADAADKTAGGEADKSKPACKDLTVSVGAAPVLIELR